MTLTESSLCFALQASSGTTHTDKMRNEKRLCTYVCMYVCYNELSIATSDSYVPIPYWSFRLSKVDALLIVHVGVAMENRLAPLFPLSNSKPVP